MSEERYRRPRAAVAEEYDFSSMYDDIDRIRHREKEEEKEQNEKLGSAGMMALMAGVGIAAVVLFGNVIGGGDLYAVLYGMLHVIGFGALGYGLLKTLRLAFREKDLNFPALNVYRKSKPVPPPAREATRSRTSSNSSSERTHARRQRSRQRQRSQQATSYRGRVNANERKLKRSRRSRVFSGVAGGLAEYFGISPNLLRFAFILSIFPTSGFSIFIYLLLSIVIPADYPSRGDVPGQGIFEREN